MNRSRLDPIMAGRSCLIGLAWALSPTVGVQMLGVFLTWCVVDRALGLRFALTIALAITFVTNPLTAPPLYSLYHLTGSLMLGDDPGAFGVEPFREFVEMAMAAKWLEAAKMLWEALSGPVSIILLGSVPYVVVGAVAGYWFGRWIGHRLARRRTDAQRRRSPDDASVGGSGDLGAVGRGPDPQKAG